MCSHLSTVTQPAGPAAPTNTPSTPSAASITSTSTSSNTHSPATPTSPTRPSLSNPTATESSSHSSALSTPGVSASSSGGDGSPEASTPLPTSTGSTKDDSTARASISSPTIPITSGSSLTPSPLSSGAVSSVSPPQSSGPHHLNTGAIVGIVLGALVALLASAIALFLLLRKRARRRGRSKSTRVSVESSESRQRLEACSYSDGTSRPASSVLTLGSALTPGGPDYDYESKLEARAHLPALAETRPLEGDASVHSLHDGLLGAPAPFGPDALSASSELLALAGTEFAMVNSLNDGRGGGGLRRSGSGLSRTTASSREVQSVEAL